MLPVGGRRHLTLLVSVSALRYQLSVPQRALQASAVLRRVSDEQHKEPLASSSQQQFDSHPTDQQPEQESQGPRPR